MTTRNQNGGRRAFPDDDRPSWRPEDQRAQSFRDDDDRDARSWRERSYPDEDRHASRDPRRWEGSRGSEIGYHDDDRPRGRSTEYYGQGQSGYSAGRYGDDPAQRLQNRNEMYPSGYSSQDRNQGLGLDERFTNRGEGQGRDQGRGRDRYWLDRSDEPERRAPDSHGGGRFEPDRYASRSDWRPYDDRMGYQRGGGSSERLGYQGGYQNSSYEGYRVGFRDDGRSESQRYTGEQESRRDPGPHRGKGPLGYQRSDERLREMICEQLTDDEHIDASQIEVTVKNGEVTLTGTVEDRRAKRDAEDCACNVAGVRDVQNQLRVKDDQRSQSSSTRPGSSTQAAQTTQTPMTSSIANGKPEESAQQDKKHRA